MKILYYIKLFYLLCIAFEFIYMYLDSFKHEINEFTRLSTDFAKLIKFFLGYEKFTYL